MPVKLLFTKKQPYLIAGLFFASVILTGLKIISGPLGLSVMLTLFFYQARLLNNVLIKRGTQDEKAAPSENDNHKSESVIFLLAYYLVSLSLIYYVVGLSKTVFLIWLSLNILAAAFIAARQEIYLPFFTEVTSKLKRQLNLTLSNIYIIFILVIGAYLLSYFSAIKVFDGSPSPWLSVHWTSFILFFILTYLAIKNYLNGEDRYLVAVLYFFIIIGLVAIKYVLTFGYDTLLHQATLDYIARFGRIQPLTPYYIGQYSLELLANFFTGWNFSLIERWLTPLLFIVLTSLSAARLLARKKIYSGLTILPVSLLFLLPNQFFYTSPYAMALLWCMLAAASLFSYLAYREKSDYRLALTAAIASVFIHPFVGLNILLWVIAVKTYGRLKGKNNKRIFLVAAFIITSTIVVIAFGLYSWLKNSILVLDDPIYYSNNFFSLFNDPIWYDRTAYSAWLGLLYFYEKIQFILVILLAVYYLIMEKSKRKTVLFFMLISLSILISAWFFISGFEVSGYTFGDQINYAFRLLGMAKWILWPVILLAMIKIFVFIGKKSARWQTVFALLASLILTASWYLTYPRSDDISRPNVNNIRQIDYQAIDFINRRENGKDGYLVFANQLFGAAAVKQYGFKPYYDSPWGNLFYYSIPMSSELNKRYESILSSESFDQQTIFEVLKKIGLRRAYLVTTDYWPLSDASDKQAEKQATAHWDINQQIFIYEFELKD